MKIVNKLVLIYLTLVLIIMCIAPQGVFAARRYLVASGDFNQTSPSTIWSATSGGSAGASVPGSGDWVILDANSNGFTVTLDANVIIDSLSISDGTFNTSTFNLRVSNTTDLNGGILTLGSGVYTFIDSVNISNGTLNAGTGNIRCNSNFSFLGGTINEQSSTLSFINGGGSDQFLRTNADVTLNNISVSQGFLNTTNGVTFDNKNSTNPVAITVGGNLTMNYPDQQGISRINSAGGSDLPSIVYGDNSTLLYSSSNPDFQSSQLPGDEFTSTVRNLTISVGSTNPFTDGVDATSLGDRTVIENLTLSLGRLTHTSQTLSVGGAVSMGSLSTSGSYVGGTIELINTTSQEIYAGSGSISNLALRKGSTSDVVTVVSGILNITGNLTIETGIFTLGPGSNGLSLSGSSVLQVQASGTFQTGGKTITNPGSYDLQSGSTFEFNGTLTQESTPSGLTFSNIRMSNSFGLNILGNVVVNGTLTFAADNRILVSGGSNTLTFGPSAAIAGENTDRFILGPVRKQFTNTGSFSYPVGVEDGGSFYYRPAVFNYVSGTFGGTSIIRLAYSRSSFGPKLLPPGISAIDQSGHYIVTEIGTAPTDFEYEFTGTFDDGNFPLESRNRAIVETASSYTVASSNTVIEADCTVTSGTFSTLPVDNNFIVFGAGGTLVSWNAGDGDWATASNWDPQSVPTSTDDVLIDANALVSISGTTSAEAQTLILGNSSGTTSPILNVGGSSNNPLRIYQTSAVSLTVYDGATLRISNSQNETVKFGASGGYDASLTDFLSNSAVEYQTAPLPLDVYENLTINGTSSTAGSGTFTVNGDFIKQNSTTFQTSESFVINGDYTNTAGNSNFLTGLTFNGGNFNVTAGNIGGTVTFSTNSSQSIGGTASPVIFNNMTIDNANGLSLNTNVQVNGSLNLTNGIVSTGSNIFTLGTSASVASISNSSYIAGNVANIYNTTSTSRQFPVGSQSIYRMLSLRGYTLSGTATLLCNLVGGNANTIATVVAPLEAVSFVRYYTFSNSSANAILFDKIIDCRVNTDDGVGTLVSNATLRFAANLNATGDWVELTLDPSTPNTSTIPTNISSATYSPVPLTTGDIVYLSLATTSIGDNPLPVDLVAFTAVGKAGKVVLNWETASEVNNMGFDVYRSENETGTYQKTNQEIIQGLGTGTTSHYYEYEDTEVEENSTYYYKLYSRDFDGTIHDYGRIVSATVQPLPKDFAVAQNYPNPFNPSTKISFDVAKESAITLEIYNMLGQKVRTLIDNQRYQPGVYNDVIWNARDDQGNSVANGIYYLVFSAKDYEYRQVRKMVFMK